MKFDPTLVVKSPPEHQGSVLCRIVVEQSCLEILDILANEVQLTSVRAELTALRNHPQEKLFSFTVGNDIEPSSKKSVLELCWETLERVQHLNRRIALYPDAYRERIERSGKLHYFLIRVAGIAGGPVAESMAMVMDSCSDRRVRDYEAEAACPNYLVESFGYQPEEKGASEKVRSFETNWCLSMVRMSVGVRNGWEFTPREIVRLIPTREIRDRGNWVRVNPPVLSNFWSVLPEPEEKRFVALPVKPWVDSSREEFLTLYGSRLNAKGVQGVNLRKGETLDEYAARHKNDDSVTARPLKNWCDTCKQYVAWSHDGATGIPCKDYLKKIEADEAERVATMYAPAEQVVPRRDATSCSDGPINTNWVEDRWIARMDRNKALRRLLAKSEEPYVEDAPTVRTQRKPKRHYVRHGAADFSFVRKQDLELATDF